MEATIPNCSNSSIECGEEAAKEFAFAEGYRNLNHGSYGTYPIAVRNAFRKYQERIEARPDTFTRFEYRTELLHETRATLARYLDVPLDTCVFVPNATTGIDTVLRNLACAPGDVVICFDTVYDSFAFTLDFLTETTPLAVHRIKYALPASDAELCAAFSTAVHDVRARGHTPVLALFDTVSSIPGTRMPFAALTALCRELRVRSCIDGAHGVGLLPDLALRALDPDFFVSNCHKWLHVPRACAVLYVPARNQHLLRATLPTGFGYKAGFAANFANYGTLDCSALLCVPAALAWRARLTWGARKGEAAAMGYVLELAREGGQAVARVLGTEVLDNAERSLGNCGMANVRLPLDLRALTDGNNAQTAALVRWLMRSMTVDHETAVLIVSYAGAVWARLSAQVYLTLRDFEHAALKLKETCERAQKGEWESSQT